FVLPEFPGVPVYASTLARGLLGNKIKEHKLNNNPLLALEPGGTVEVGPFSVRGFRIGHSIPDAMGLGIRTPLGTIIHTGDFKFDHTPVDGKLSDFHELAAYGAEGVLCLLSDSTRAENPGYTGSERLVGEAFRDIIQGVDGRVIVATFASNIARIQQVFDAAADFKRKVTVIGRSMEQNTRIAVDLGYLKYDSDQLVPKDRLRDIPDDKLVIATTGAQGEPMAGLARMANRDHRFVEIQPGDTVIVSASPIPGNEESVGRTIDNLFKVGANVYYHTIKRAHVSGHASQEELKLMLALTRPKSFIPVHGEFRMLVQHGRLAAEVGVNPENIFIIENGQSIEFLPDGSARRGQRVEAGYVYVDGLSVGEVGDVVLRDRRALANDGMFLVVITVDKQTGNLVGRPEIVTRGFVADVQPRMLEGAIDRITRSIENPGDHISEITLLKAQIKDGLSQYLYQQTKRRPMVFPVVVEV
ncbi:MAG: ribonuclease J, partial [Chloroflexota bacterium]|nr:ribonuclease J [Chloroflexota bacterium]